MPVTSVNLSVEVQKRLGVTEIHDSFRGGQKEVFIVTRNTQKVAIKILHYGLQAREQREIDFYKDHAHLHGIPKIIEILEIDGQPIIIEEYIEGNRLDTISGSYLRDHQKISALIRQVCDVMEPVWAASFVHRDLKPENIIIQPDFSPVIIDFGIYKNPDITTITETGFQPNTCHFASPEQLVPEIGAVSYRSDYFSLGVIVFNLFFGVLPFGQDRESIKNFFRAEKLWPIPGFNSALDDFFDGVFQLRPSMRVRNTQLLKKRLTQ